MTFAVTRSIKTIIIVAFGALVMATGGAAQPAGDKAQERAQGVKNDHQGTTLDQYKKLSHVRGSRKIHFQEKRPAKGIASGLVMAYGHVIQPPYELKVDGARLLINGVQIKPSLVMERNTLDVAPVEFTPEEKSTRRRVGRLQIRAREIYADANSKSGAEKEILDLLAAESGLISNAVWRGTRLCFNSQGNPMTQCWDFRKDILNSSERTNRNTKDMLAAAKAEIERNLKSGETVVCDALGQHGVARISRESVVEIMERPGLSNDARTELLKERIFGNYETPMDIVENYSRPEWTSEK
jgi:hypothetical protein